MFNATDTEIEAWRTEQAQKIFQAGRPRQISPAFDAPQFCQDWMDVAKRTVRATGLKVMVRDTKVDKSGVVVPNKKTKRPVMTWRAWN